MLDVVCCHSNKGSARGKRHFKFHDKGKFEQLAQRMRTKVVDFMLVMMCEMNHRTCWHDVVLEMSVCLVSDITEFASTV